MGFCYPSGQLVDGKVVDVCQSFAQAMGSMLIFVVCAALFIVTAFTVIRLVYLAWRRERLTYEQRAAVRAMVRNECLTAEERARKEYD